MSADGPDSALETLLLPLLDGPLAWPEAGGALFLRARDGWPLHQRAWPGLVCEQSFRPEADALQRSGLPLVEADADTRHPLVLLLPPRQREEARALYARAIARTAPDGRVLACLRNDEGAKSGEADLARLAGPVASLTKNKCRAFWTAPLHGAADPALFAEWRQLDAPRAIAGGRFTSRPGVFAWDRIDAASALLAAHLPPDLHGEAADLGAGYGYLAHELLARCPRITALDLYEAERRALDLARMNLAAQGARVDLAYHWHDVTTGLGKRFDVIVSNPPFHAQGRADRPDIGRRFIAVAAEALRPGGRLWLVANRHLPYEAELARQFAQVRVVVQAEGFKVFEATRLP
ncbi:class I SAM-dependent methyltransferase [Lysobacter solisilvae (ex Woo and Kim 2020)]|uniref:Class I SAM-dependent methyltransferase n=1 Tax=Agrilutibacter terrestris TaxID=2865112 RepID=A0A7H0G048_9GAMM|nr:class I SAM-dependent methyltransferase [Lysobacter terrestris]QNP41664.1 class I SAM-dependent methyltransferase [Lysobacter terrestris]